MWAWWHMPIISALETDAGESQIQEHMETLLRERVGGGGGVQVSYYVNISKNYDVCIIRKIIKWVIY